MMDYIELGLNPPVLKWEAPTENVDGSQIKGPLSYNVYRTEFGSVLGPENVFFNVVGDLQPDGKYTLPTGQFPLGTHVVVLTAVDTEGDESDYSNAVVFTITDEIPPRPPVMLAL